MHISTQQAYHVTTQIVRSIGFHDVQVKEGLHLAFSLGAFLALDKYLKSMFLANAIRFPSALFGMLSLFLLLTTLSAVSTGIAYLASSYSLSQNQVCFACCVLVASILANFCPVVFIIDLHHHSVSAGLKTLMCAMSFVGAANKVEAFFSPAILFIQRWLPLFYVPSLVVVPLAVKGIPASEGVKIGAILCIDLHLNLDKLQKLWWNGCRLIPSIPPVPHSVTYLYVTRNLLYSSYDLEGVNHESVWFEQCVAVGGWMASLLVAGYTAVQVRKMVNTELLPADPVPKAAPFTSTERISWIAAMLVFFGVAVRYPTVLGPESTTAAPFLLAATVVGYLVGTR